MKIQLGQFALFAHLQAELAAITAEQLVTVRAGKPLEADGKVIGVMPDHLKGLLYLRDQIIDTVNKIIDTSSARSRPDGELDKVFTELANLKEAHEKANALFWDALRAEFPDFADKTGLGYGPNFEVYYTDTAQERYLLEKILHGVVVHLG